MAGTPTALFAPAHIIQRRLPPGSAGGGAHDAPTLVYGLTGLVDPRLIYNYAASPTGAGVVGIGTVCVGFSASLGGGGAVSEFASSSEGARCW